MILTSVQSAGIAPEVNLRKVCMGEIHPGFETHLKPRAGVTFGFQKTDFLQIHLDENIHTSHTKNPCPVVKERNQIITAGNLVARTIPFSHVMYAFKKLPVITIPFSSPLNNDISIRKLLEMETGINIFIDHRIRAPCSCHCIMQSAIY